jgi:hypothetical protein
MSSPLRRLTGAAVVKCLVGLLLALPSLAAAETSKYPPNVAARGFDGGLAGWTASSSSEGTCLPPLLCPSVSNAFQPSGGADGGGYIRSTYQGAVGAMAVGGTTTAVYTSPPFTYRGAGGETPTAVVFEMDRRASVDQLLAVSGNSATYSVRLTDLSAGGEMVTLLAPATLAGASSWRNAPRESVKPERLVDGHDYKVLVTTTYVTGTSTFVSGNADYDNVILAASRSEGNDRGAGAGNGDGLSRERLGELVRAAMPQTAVIKGKGRRLLVRTRCPRKVGRACRITMQGLLRKHKPATARRTVKLRKGRSKLVVLRVKASARAKLRAKLSGRKRLLVRNRVRAGKVTATVYEKRRLIRR